jgi:hypothetical protein
MHVSLSTDTLSVYRVDTDNQTFQLLWQLRTDNRLSSLFGYWQYWQYQSVMQPDGSIYFYHYNANATNPL